MTYEQIEKGLEHCGNGEEIANCEGCPYFEEGNCIDLHKDALGYINRLKAENAKLQEWKRRQQICNETNTERIMQLEDEKAQIRKETAKEIYNDFKGFIRKDEVSLLLWLQAVIERYGVEVQ